MYTNYFLLYQLVIRRTIFHISSIILKIIPFTIIILKFVYILFIRHIVLEQLFLEQFRIQDSNLSIEKSRMHRRAEKQFTWSEDSYNVEAIIDIETMLREWLLDTFRKFQRAKHEYNEKRCDKGENGKIAVARKGQYCVKNE